MEIEKEKKFISADVIKQTISLILCGGVPGLKDGLDNGVVFVFGRDFGQKPSKKDIDECKSYGFSPVWKNPLIIQDLTQNFPNTKTQHNVECRDLCSNLLSLVNTSNYSPIKQLLKSEFDDQTELEDYQRAIATCGEDIKFGTLDDVNSKMLELFKEMPGYCEIIKSNMDSMSCILSHLSINFEGDAKTLWDNTYRTVDDNTQTQTLGRTC